MAKKKVKTKAKKKVGKKPAKTRIYGEVKEPGKEFVSDEKWFSGWKADQLEKDAEPAASDDSEELFKKALKAIKELKESSGAAELDADDDKTGSPFGPGFNHERFSDNHAIFHRAKDIPRPPPHPRMPGEYRSGDHRNKGVSLKGEVGLGENIAEQILETLADKPTTEPPELQQAKSSLEGFETLLAEKTKAFYKAKREYLVLKLAMAQTYKETFGED